MRAEVCHNGLNYIFFSPLPAAPQATPGKEERSACCAKRLHPAVLLHYKIIRTTPSPLNVTCRP
jgi:alanine-synthesizing transaminase